MLNYDAQFLTAFQAMMKGREMPEPFPAGDWQNRREQIGIMMESILSNLVIPADIEVSEHTAQADDGFTLPLRIYCKTGTRPSAVIYYTHGGGKFACCLDTHDPLCRLHAATSDVAIVAVGFRLPPEHPFPVPVEDCYAGLQWLHEHATELGFDENKISVAGDSGGGGFAASVAIMARDRQGPKLASQILFYPMLDDRNTVPDPNLVPFAIWTYDDNLTGWKTLLGDATGGDNVSPYAAPSRETNYAGLPPAYIDVGDMDIFRDESIAYAANLVKAGVSVELHVLPGVPHGFEFLAFDIDVSKSVREKRAQFMRKLGA